jgi:hypothetical protein
MAYSCVPLENLPALEAKREHYEIEKVMFILGAKSL